jgi:hypothetical protein
VEGVEVAADEDVADVHQQVQLHVGYLLPNPSRFQNNCFSVLRRSSKEVTYLRLVECCFTHF